MEVEEGKAIGFEAWSIDRLKNLTEEERKRFMPLWLKEDYMNLFEKLKDIKL